MRTSVWWGRLVDFLPDGGAPSPRKKTWSTALFLDFLYPALLNFQYNLKGRVMGPLLVLVCPCFRENAIATSKIVSFLCRLGNFLLKNVVVFFFENQISKWRSFEKKMLFLTYFSHKFYAPGKRHKNFLAQTSRTYTYFAHPIDFFCFTNFAKITNYVWFSEPKGETCEWMLHKRRISVHRFK